MTTCVVPELLTIMDLIVEVQFSTWWHIHVTPIVNRTHLTWFESLRKIQFGSKIVDTLISLFCQTFVFLLISIHRIPKTVCYYSLLHSGNEINRIISVIIFQIPPPPKEISYMCKLWYIGIVYTHHLYLFPCALLCG